MNVVAAIMAAVVATAADAVVVADGCWAAIMAAVLAAAADAFVIADGRGSSCNGSCSGYSCRCVSRRRWTFRGCEVLLL